MCGSRKYPCPVGNSEGVVGLKGQKLKGKSEVKLLYGRERGMPIFWKNVILHYTVQVGPSKEVINYNDKKIATFRTT